MISFITINLNKKSQQNSYEVAFFSGRMKILTMRKYITLCTCDAVEVQQFFMSLSSVLHVVEHVNIFNIDPCW